MLFKVCVVMESCFFIFFFFKQKTAYEMRISDWSSDVCSSDLMFRYALVIAEGLEVNPAADLDVVAEPKPPVAHNPYLHLPEMPEFLQKLRLYNPRGWQTQLGVRLLFLTGVRTGEIGSASCWERVCRYV